jgi:hypothetical protein
MPNAYYTCNLLPTELVARSGYSPRWLGDYLQDPAAPARRAALSIHPMTCPYVTQLVAAADVLLDSAPRDDCLLVPGGCDAMRRMGDLLEATYPGRVFVLSMPRTSGEGAVRTLAADLARMEDWLGERLARGDRELAAGAGAAGASDLGAATVAAGAAGAAATAVTAGGEGPPTQVEPSGLEYPTAPRPGGVFVVAGPLSDDSLLRLIGQLGAGIAGLDSCTSPERRKPLAALPAPRAGAPAGAPRAQAGAPNAADSNAETTGDYVDLAAALLTMGMCPRRSTADRRDHLIRRLDETRPSSIIYARQSFCDPGAYDALLVSRLAEERGLPYLEIEVGFPFEAGGPLRTRVEAFLEAQLLDDDLLDDDLLDDLVDSGFAASDAAGEEG